ncbi:MAG: GPW/gp25 family protein [Chloroflexota bacterium]|nr:GPW/gp25 family protein [Chloroflexota bacterium]
MTTPQSINAFLGQGWRFPPAVDGAGGIAMTIGEKDIEASIKVILATAKGERVMRPEFGSIIQDFVFSPNNATTHGLLSYHVTDALRQWEPRIEVIRVDATADPEEPAQVRIEIGYRVKATNDERNLVYPFYLIPREE